jgi:hypothetical protein
MVVTASCYGYACNRWAAPSGVGVLRHCIAVLAVPLEILGPCPGSVAAGCDWETHGAANNWPSIVRVRGGFSRQGCSCPITHGPNHVVEMSLSKEQFSLITFFKSNVFLTKIPCHNTLTNDVEINIVCYSTNFSMGRKE